jgi:hypothetical protein
MKFFILKQSLIKKKYINTKNIKLLYYYSIILKKNSNNFINNLNHKIINLFLKINLKKGLKKKIKIIFSKLFSLFINFFKFNDFYQNDFNNQIEIQIYNYTLNRNLYLINIFLNNLVVLLSPLFIIYFKKNKKKIKKNDKRYKKYTYSFNYIPASKRLNIVLKSLYNYSNYFIDKNFFIRLFKSLFYTFLEEKQSFLYLKKVETYLALSTSKKDQ